MRGVPNGASLSFLIERSEMGSSVTKTLEQSEMRSTFKETVPRKIFITHNETDGKSYIYIQEDQI